MRLQAAFLLLAYSLPSWAIFADEVNHIDYHHALLGTPEPRNTFFHRPISSSSASLLYTLSDKLVVGAINPKDGVPVWRQNLSDSSAAVTTSGLLRAADGEDTVFSGVGREISSWGASDGKLGWTTRLDEGSVVVDLELVDAAAGKEQGAGRDVIMLAQSRNGFVKRLDGSTGLVKWEHKDNSDDIPLRVSSSPTATYYISLQPALLKGYKIKVTELNTESGRVTSQQTLSTESEVLSVDHILFVGSNAAVPVIVWMDTSPEKKLKLNILGSKSVLPIDNGNDSGETIRSARIHAANDPAAKPHIAVHYETASKSLVDVYHIDAKAGTISRAHRLPLLEEPSVIAASARDGNVYFTRVTPSKITVSSSTSEDSLGTWASKSKVDGKTRFAVSEVASRGSTAAVRFAQVEESGDWNLVRNGELEWERPESLADAVSMAWADMDGVEGLAHELEVEGHQFVLSAYTHRLLRHVRDLQAHFPTWITELPMRVLSSFLPNDNSDFLQFGFGKLVIVATSTGRIIGVDSGHGGKVIWNTKVVPDEKESNWSAKLITTHQGSATVYIGDGSTVTVDISTGSITSQTPPTQNLKSIVPIPGQTAFSTTGIDSNGHPTPAESVPDGDKFIVSVSEDGKVLGWATRNLKTPAWEFLPPKGYKVIHATARPGHDPVASIGKVLGDRSVLYKYLDPNLILVTAVGDSTAAFYLLDGVSGQILHSVTHDGIDTFQPISSVISENWFAYSFWADETKLSDSKGYQLIVSELYESPIPNDRGLLNDAQNYSSIRGDAGLPRPHVISQAYMIPESISNMAVTQTRQGIAIRQLLCTLPEANAIVGIPRPVLDPRRPVGRDPTANEKEEGLTKYSPFLDFDPRWYLTHMRDVSGIQHIASSPTLLESSTLVFAYGFDVFGIRVAPSQAFDLLGKGFSKVQLVLTIVALAAGVAALTPITRRKQVNAKWKA